VFVIEHLFKGFFRFFELITLYVSHAHHYPAQGSSGPRRPEFRPLSLRRSHHIIRSSKHNQPVLRFLTEASIARRFPILSSRRDPARLIVRVSSGHQPVSPIIRHRVLLVRGDLSFARSHYEEAITLYEAAIFNRSLDCKAVPHTFKSS
jgi:hypothetical protein